MPTLTLTLNPLTLTLTQPLGRFAMTGAMTGGMTGAMTGGMTGGMTGPAAVTRPWTRWALAHSSLGSVASTVLVV